MYRGKEETNKISIANVVEYINHISNITYGMSTLGPIAVLKRNYIHRVPKSCIIRTWFKRQSPSQTQNHYPSKWYFSCQSFSYIPPPSQDWPPRSRIRLIRPSQVTISRYFGWVISSGGLDFHLSEQQILIVYIFFNIPIYHRFMVSVL